MNWEFLCIWDFEIQIGSLGNLFFDKGLFRALLIWRKKGKKKERLTKPSQSSFIYRITKNVLGRMAHIRLTWHFTGISNFWLFPVSLFESVRDPTQSFSMDWRWCDFKWDNKRRKWIHQLSTSKKHQFCLWKGQPRMRALVVERQS